MRLSALLITALALLGTLTITGGAMAGADTQDARTVSELVQWMDTYKVRASPKQVSSCIVCSQDASRSGDDAFHRGVPDVSLDRACSGATSFLSFCSGAAAACAFKAGRSSCWSDSSVRSKDPRRVKKILQETARIHRRMITDSRVLELCCESDEGCKRRYSRTGLRVIPSTGENDQTYYYDPRKNAVYFSLSLLSGCQNPECLERMVMHELGHACQFNRYTRVGAFGRVAMALLGDAFPRQVGAMGLDRIRGMNAQALRCVHGEFKSLLKRGDGSVAPVPGSWYREAFADLVFTSERRSPLHYAWDCFNPGDWTHAPPLLYFECLWKHGGLRERMCGNSGGSK